MAKRMLKLPRDKVKIEDKKNHAEQECADPLLSCILVVVQHHGRRISPTAMLAGVPLDDYGRLGPSQVEKALCNAGFEGRILKRSLGKLPFEALPAILFLDESNACVLLDVEGNNYTVAFPGVDCDKNGKTCIISRDALEKRHNGFCLFLLPQKESLSADSGALPKGHYRWLWKAIGKNWWTYAQVILASIALNCMALVTPLFIRNVYDRVIPNSSIDTLWVLAIGVFTVFVFGFVLRTLRAYFIDSTGKKIDVELEAMLFNHLTAIRYSDKPSSVGGFSSILRQVEVLRDFFTSATLTSFVDLPFVIIFIALFYYIGGPMAFTLVAALPLVIIAGVAIHFPMKHSVKSALAMGYGKQSVLVETLSNMETVKSLGCGAFVRKRWNQHIIESAKHSIRSRSLSQLAIDITTFIQNITYLVIVIIGVHLVKEGEITIGSLVACSMLSSFVMGPFIKITQLITRLHYTTSAFKELDRVMNLPSERADTNEILSRPVLNGQIQLKGVSFTYPRATLPALNKITFSIEAGERVGIIGKTGSGKTTIGKLVMNLYAPSEGAVLVDRTDIRQIDPFDLRRWVGYVSQDVTMFQGSVRENICVGNPQASDQDVLEAATAAGVDDFIRNHPRGYALPVEERGENLSGGQRQSIAIARALLRRPNVLVLDEPTSSLDNTSEMQLMRRLSDYLKGKTLILMTHRPALLNLVDRLIVVDCGCIVADGSKDSIIHRLQNGNVPTAYPGKIHTSNSDEQ